MISCAIKVNCGPLKMGLFSKMLQILEYSQNGQGFHRTLKCWVR